MIEAYYAGRGNLKGISKVGRHDGKVGEGSCRMLCIYTNFFELLVLIVIKNS